MSGFEARDDDEEELLYLSAATKWLPGNEARRQEIYEGFPKAKGSPAALRKAASPLPSSCGGRKGL